MTTHPDTHFAQARGQWHTYDAKLVFGVASATQPAKSNFTELS
ncbi:hypothetical protein AB1L30_04900 [Bremerella sp. JC817]